ncbi:MAG: rRNA maturation RNase YbeY [Candidatus Omnitrophota bacterium]
MSLTVRTTNLNKRYDLDLDAAEKAARCALRYLKKKKCSLEIIFLSDEKMRALNRKYMRVNRSTDVLSFNMESSRFGIVDFSGCIFISSDKASTNSFRFETTFEKEIILYIIHGILHLNGYDDTTARKRRAMSSKENEILGLLCKKPSVTRILSRAKRAGRGRSRNR